MFTARKKPDPGVDKRLASLDALRGFDMFWIVGADGLFRALEGISGGGIISAVTRQLGHSDWEGFTFEDLVFPLFVFIAGVSLVFSLDRTIATRGKAAAYSRVIRRSLLLFALGIFYYGGFANSWPDIRLLGVLQRIALCYLFAGLIYLTFGLRSMLAICVAILGGYWALMTLFPAPGVAAGAGPFGEGANLADYLDRLYLPGKKYGGDHDPEGLLSTLPAVSSCLLGVFSGILLKSRRLSGYAKTGWLFAFGLASLLLGFFWGGSFPVIKKIWTSSYVLVAGGYSAILLGAFYLVIDVWNRRSWSMPFIWIGMNALTIYLANNIVGFDDIARRLVGGDIAAHIGSGARLAVTVAALGLNFALAGYMYRKKAFLRV